LLPALLPARRRSRARFLWCSASAAIRTQASSRASRVPAATPPAFHFSLDLSVKRVDLLKEAKPAMTRVAVLSNPDHAGDASELKATRETADALGLVIEHFEVRTDASFDPAFAAIAQSKCDGLLAFPDALTNFNRQKIVAFALRRRLPSIFGWKMYVEAGGFMSYGPIQHDAFARLAVYVDKILKGAKPADLPVEQPTKLEMAINLKTAKALGLEIPPGLILRADELIE
jgi:putative tryptophan/tyrosine transport system substrate-binding protein